MKKMKFKLLGITCMAMLIAFIGPVTVKADMTAHADLVNLSSGKNFDWKMNCPYQYHFVSFRPNSNPNGAYVKGEVRNDDWIHTMINYGYVTGLREGAYSHLLVYSVNNQPANRWFNGVAQNGTIYGNMQFSNSTSSNLNF